MQVIAVERSKWTAWIDLAAALSVLIGLIFVALEVRQNNEHARADSVRDLFQMWSDIYQFEYQHGIQDLVRRSIEESDDFTEEDFLRLGKYLDLVMNAYLTQAVMQQEADLVIGDIVEEAPQSARVYFASNAARIWLRDNEEWLRNFSPEFHAALIVEVERSPVVTKMPELESYRRRN